MSVKNDAWIIERAEKGMIEPFEPSMVQYNANGEKIISYGTSSYGYDIRCAPEFHIFTNVYASTVDPKKFREDSFVSIQADKCVLPPNSFVLGRSLEHFRIPREVLAVCIGKSTYARCGIIVNVTPLEPEWEGYITLEFSNTTSLPVVLYANEGVAQIIFYGAAQECLTSYKDRKGKYMGQTGITTPIV